MSSLKTKIKRRLYLLVCLLIVFTNSKNIYAQNNLQAEVNSYLKNLPFNAPNISVSNFPDKDFNIINYGAVGNGLVLNTEAFAKAVNDCAKNGGGHVIVPAGAWLTGSIELKSNVDLHLEKGALVIFSSNHKDFPLAQLGSSKNYDVMSPIYGYNLKNIAITGEGIFDGNGDTWRPVKKGKLTQAQWKSLLDSGGVVNDKEDTWWPSTEAMNAEKYLSQKKRNELTIKDYENVRDFLRPYLLCLDNCKTILLDNITLQNSPKFAMNLRKCDNLVVRKVRVNNEWWAQNGDGLDLSSCKNVLMYDCTVNAGDDGICMKSSGKPEESPAMENIIIADCVVYHAHGGFVIGSNTDGGIRNIYVKNCNFIWSDVGLRFKSGLGRGGLIENIFIDGVYMKNIENEAILFDMYYADAAAIKMADDKIETSRAPHFQNIFMKNIVCDGADRAFYINDLPYTAVKNIELSDAVIISKKGFESVGSENIKLSNVTIKTKTSPLFSISNSKGFYLNNITCGQEVQTFMKLRGAKTENINITKTRTDCSKTPFEFDKDVNPKAVIVN